MEPFLPDSVKAVLAGLVAIAFSLSWLARSRPHVAWLQAFRLPEVHRTEEQKARRRRSWNRMAAIQIILFGLALPFLYLLSTIFRFSEPEATPSIIAGAGSVVCIALGIWIFVRNR